MKKISLDKIVKLSMELTEIQTEAVNKTVELADKYGIDRDVVFETMIGGLMKASMAGTLKEYKVTKTGAEWKEHMMKHFTKGE
jgi:3-hydroxyisobutyrate dehydrogenase-like beta-hydroxyacid dehydrogenase